MNKDFCDSLSSFTYKQKMNEIKILKEKIKNHTFFNNIDFIEKDMKKGLLDPLIYIERYYLNLNDDKDFVENFYSFEYYIDMYLFGLKHDKLIKNPGNLNKENEIKWAKEIKKDFNNIFFWDYNIYNLKDSDPTFFDEDIIITDPCYIMKDEDWDEFCNDNKNILKEKIPSIIWRDTLYGDWSCSVFSNNTVIGNFCADAGLVCVAKLDEVLSYNPNFDYHINKPWTTTLIKDFKGFINFEVLYCNNNVNLFNIIKNKDEYVNLNDFRKNLGNDIKEIFQSFYVQVVGTGINKNNNEPLNWIGCQTGF